MPDNELSSPYTPQIHTMRKVILSIVFFFLFVAGFLFGAFILQEKNEKNIAAHKVNQNSMQDQIIPARTTTLSLNPKTASLKVGQTIPVKVVIDKQPVQAADVTLRFDPDIFEIQDVRPSKEFPNLLRQSVQEGVALVSVSIPFENLDESHTGELFSFTLKALKDTKASTIDFNPRDTLAAKDGDNVLSVMVGGSYKVLN